MTEAVNEVESKPVTVNPDLKWYVVHTYSGFEEKAKQALMDRAKMQNLLPKVGEIIIPKTVQESQTKTGKRKQVSKTSYPGYILVQLILDDQTKYLVKDTPKITGFVGNQQNPRPISDQEVLRLTSPETATQQARVESKVSFEKHERVKVIDGPFTNFDGMVDDVKPDKMKVRVLVSIFGRETPVELDYAQVQKIS